MVGPSARGSLNGTPTSMISAMSASARSAEALASRVGYPAVRYGMRARLPVERRADQVCVSGDSDEMIANGDTIASGVGDFNDGSAIGPALVLLAEAYLSSRRRHGPSIGVHCDP